MLSKTAVKVWTAMEWETFLDARVIAQRAELPENRTCEKVRFAVAELRDIGLPVVSGEGRKKNQKGFTKTTFGVLLGDCSKNLKAKAQTILERAHRFYELSVRPMTKTACNEMIRLDQENQGS